MQRDSVDLLIEPQSASGSSLQVDGLAKAYVSDESRVLAVDGVSFSVRDGEFYTLLGPSGCGKTTTLRCVAGLERSDGGTIAIGGYPVTNVPAHKRDIGMVFQSYAIWPHLSVFENVAFPLRVASRRFSKSELRNRVDEALATVQLDKLGGRMATQLSGGQQQRLALARALVRRPKILLLDEPLSNLDARLRETLRVELRSLQRRVHVTTLYVTHDQSEALSMSNRVAVMEGGKITQEGSPREIYEAPKSRFVAEFVGTTNFIDCTVITSDSRGSDLMTSFGRVRFEGQAAAPPGTPFTLMIRPERVEISDGTNDASDNALIGEVEQRLFLGDFIDYRIRVGSDVLLVRQPPGEEYRRGDSVRVQLPSACCSLLASDGTLIGPPVSERRE